MEEGGDCEGCRGEAKASDRIAQPAAHEPTSASSGQVAGPVPDLRSLPAWGISVAPDGNFLRFAATVWNAGNSPLVVDGFRRADEDEMDAYQYFFDAEGNQTGYQQVGSMHWDSRSTHQHWHFEDFARYSLLDAGKVEAVRSKKEAFCLANTDSVDTTVPDASWNPENTDLETSCGEYSSLSIREVLASGWGDTYAQFRAGTVLRPEGAAERHLLHRRHRQPVQPARGSLDHQQRGAAQGLHQRQARTSQGPRAPGGHHRGAGLLLTVTRAHRN